MAQVYDQWTKKAPDGHDENGKLKYKTVRTERWGKGKRWLARWEEGGHRVSQAFDGKKAAEAFLSRTVTEQADGIYIAKANKDVTVREVWPIWWSTKAGKSKSTRAGYEAAWKHIEAKWGGIACSAISRAGVVAWLPTLRTTHGCKPGESKPVGEATQRKVGIVLAALLQTAVDERIIPASPMRKGDIPRQKVSERRYLSVAELDRLRDVAPSRRELLVVDVLSRTGLRPGEAFGLQVGDLDSARGRLRIMRDVDQAGAADETKTRRHRDVPVGGDLLLDLEDAAEGRARGEWLLTNKSGVGWTASRWRGLWATMVADANLGDLDTYELRHTAASLAIHSGANVKTVQRMLGHASAAMTLDIYGHLWDDELDALPAQMDAHMKAERARFAERMARNRRQQTDSKPA